MTIEIKTLTLGIAATNCYIIGDTATGDALVIDPVDNAEYIQRTAQDADWTIRLVVATHGHFDHVLASKPLKQLTQAPFYIHEEGPFWLDQLPNQGIMFTGRPFPEAATPDRYLTSEPEIIRLGAIRLETIFTPGHSPDHLTYYLREQKIAFNGDTLFAGSIGRTDLPRCDYHTLMQSILDRLLPLGDDVRLMPGHMHPTTIGAERQTNPFLLDFMNRKT
jgi:glyoxylase-like metal-dependent hydrolase (beta-lactamase superfamily II)